MPVTNITENSAQAGGQVTSNGGASVSARGIVWDTFGPSLNINLGLTIDGSGIGDFTSEITDLTIGETYQVRAYATNSVGTAYGQTIEFTVAEGEVADLLCDVVTFEGNLIEGEEANEVSFTVPYVGGNGGYYEGGSVSSTGVAGLLASLESGVLTDDVGSITYTVSGTPLSTGTASFSLFVAGNVCTISIIVAPPGCFPTVTFFYKGETVTYGTVVANGRCWLDRNLGAQQVATGSLDQDTYGDLFQWGREDDGHQNRTSATTTVLSSSDIVGNDLFILTSIQTFWDWRSPSNDDLWQQESGINNPCPEGYRIPTEAEWMSLMITNSATAFDSPLKLPAAGSREATDNGVLSNVGTSGLYWSSTAEGSGARGMSFSSGSGVVNVDERGSGRSVRCILD